MFLAIHDQGFENVCWAYAISTMLRASIKSAIKKYNYKIGRKMLSGNISVSIYMSLFEEIKQALELLKNPNHHKMMRKELTMNIFPFGNDGTDPSIIIKLVCIRILNQEYL